MEPNSNSREEITPPTFTGVCPVCHQPILPQYYYCPNCGTKLSAAPLSTTVMTQLGIYLFSIILPMILFIFVTRWPGLKYSRSVDAKTKWIGLAAWTLLVLSTLFTVWLYWYSYVWFQGAVQSYINITNQDLNSYGF